MELRGVAANVFDGFLQRARKQPLPGVGILYYSRKADVRMYHVMTDRRCKAL